MGYKFNATGPPGDTNGLCAQGPQWLDNWGAARRLQLKTAIGEQGPVWPDLLIFQKSQKHRICAKSPIFKKLTTNIVRAKQSKCTLKQKL